jgi:hypothetical protein
MPESFFKLLPQIASHPLAIVAYICLLGGWVLWYYRRSKSSDFLSALSKIPAGQRDAFCRRSGYKYDELAQMPENHRLKLLTRRYLLIAFVATVVAILLLALSYLKAHGEAAQLSQRVLEGQNAAQHDRDVKHQQVMFHLTSLESNIVEKPRGLVRAETESPVVLDAVDTNEFNEILASIQKYFAPPGAQVDTHVMLPIRADRNTRRRVDIVVSNQIATTPVLIAFEIVRLDRFVAAVDLDAFVGKYYGAGGVAVDKVVVVGRGFSSEARQRADLLGFLPLTAEEAHSATHAELAKSMIFAGSETNAESNLWLVNLTNARVIPRLFARNGAQFPDVALAESQIIDRERGSNFGTPLNWANAVATSKRKIVIQAYKENAGRMVHVGIPVPFDNYYLQFQGKAYELGQMIIDFGDRMYFPQMDVKAQRLLSGNSTNDVLVGTATRGTNSITLVSDAAGEKLYLDIRTNSSTEEGGH